MTDEARSLGEDAAAGCVIPMMVAVDDIADWNVEARAELVLQPDCEVGVERICENDAVCRDEEHRSVKVVGRLVDAAGDMRDRSSRSLLRKTGGRQREAHAQ